MILYRIILFPLAKELRAADLGLLSTFYVDNAAFGGSERRSSQILNLLMERGSYWGYFPERYNSLFISDTPGQEEAERR